MVSDFPPGDGNVAILFLQCNVSADVAACDAPVASAVCDNIAVVGFVGSQLLWSVLLLAYLLL